MTLERQVDPPRPHTGKALIRAALILAPVVGAGILAMGYAMRPLFPEDEHERVPPTPAAPPHITVTAPPPIVIHLETVVQSPAGPALPADTLGCPALPAIDEPIGRPINPSSVDRNAARCTVMTAASAPVLAVRAGTWVWISDDDGRSWSRAFEDHAVERISVAPDGTVYALEDDKLGMRRRGDKTAWQTLPKACDDDARCERSIGTLGNEVFAFIGDQIRTSTDRGTTWKPVTSKDVTWEPRNDSELYAFRGALYQVNHYRDMCGVDDYSTYRIDTDHRVSHDVFHNYYTDTDEPVLEPSNDVDTVWTWADKCWVPADDEGSGRCKKRQPARRAMMEAAMLEPREGARALALYSNSLIELCSGGVRQVYRDFPFDHLDAVDASGRALVMIGDDLLRWSPSVGWRKLKTFPSERPRDAGSD